MKRLLSIILIGLLALTSCSTEKSGDGIQVAVSIGPQKAWVEAIAGDLVDVVVLIPPGYSPANYQPSPKQMIDFNQSDVYFYIDVPAEQNIMESVKEEGMLLVDLAEVSDDHYPARFFDEDHEDHEDYEDHEDHEDHEEHEDHDAHENQEDEEGHDHVHTGRDPHIWLSPRRVMVMIEEIVHVLSELDPDNKATYEANGQAYMDQLKQVDEELKDAFFNLKEKSFLIYHPSYGYFADDYGLNMVEIEVDGKTATIRGLESVIDFAKEHGIKDVFYQDEFDSQQAEVVADELGGKTIQLSPLSEDYIEALKYVGQKLKDILN